MGLNAMTVRAFCSCTATSVYVSNSAAPAYDLSTVEPEPFCWTAAYSAIGLTALIEILPRSRLPWRHLNAFFPSSGNKKCSNEPCFYGQFFAHRKPRREIHEQIQAVRPVAQRAASERWIRRRHRSGAQGPGRKTGLEDLRRRASRAQRAIALSTVLRFAAWWTGQSGCST